MEEQQTGEQGTLLDLSGQEYNQFWVDEKAPLFIANNPLHWKAHKLQVALARLEKIAEKNPAQFNSTVYLNTLDRLAELMLEIKNKGDVDDEVLEPGGMAGGRHEGRAQEDSSIRTISMDS